MSDKKQVTQGTAKELENNLMPRVEIAAIGSETDIEKVNEVVFELYKEAAGGREVDFGCRISSRIW